MALIHLNLWLRPCSPISPGSRRCFVWLVPTRYFSTIPFVWSAMPEPLESTQRYLSRRECSTYSRSGPALSPKQTRRLHWSENGFAASDISVFGVEAAVPAANFGKHFGI